MAHLLPQLIKLSYNGFLKKERTMGDLDQYGELDDVTRRFYQHSLRLMRNANIPFLIGGAYALAEYTGIVRHTKDLDFFILPQDAERTLAAFTAAGYATEMT